MKAVVLAAGFGQRLRPLTEYLPKVLIPILGRPAIDHVLKRLLLHNVHHIGVNVHYRAEQIKSYLAGQKKDLEIYIAQEKTILGTGGAIYNFRNFLHGDEPFWVYNGDIICDFDLLAALRFHQRKKPLATLILWDYPPINTVSLDGEGNIINFFSKPKCGTLTFTGISILSPRLLDYLPSGYSEMPQIYQNIIVSQGVGKICGLIGRGRYWMDFGTLERYLNLHRDLLIGQSPGYPTGCVYRSGAKIRVANHTDLKGFVSIGDGCAIEEKVFLQDCVLWPGTTVQAGTRARRAVLSQNFICQVE